MKDIFISNDEDSTSDLNKYLKGLGFRTYTTWLAGYRIISTNNKDYCNAQLEGIKFLLNNDIDTIYYVDEHNKKKDNLVQRISILNENTNNI